MSLRAAHCSEARWGRPAISANLLFGATSKLDAAARSEIDRTGLPYVEFSGKIRSTKAHESEPVDVEGTALERVMGIEPTTFCLGTRST